jgi:hypothetical protein
VRAEQGFPFEYTPERLVDDYFVPQFDKYLQKSNELISLRQRIESSLLQEKTAKQTAAIFASSPEGKRQAQQQEAERQRRAQAIAAAAAATLAREYPYYAVMTCGGPGFYPVFFGSCLVGSMNTGIELRNGDKYGMYTINGLHEIGQLTRDGLTINLRRSFEIRTRNASPSFVLGIKIFRRSDGRLVFERQVTQLGVITAAM